MITHKRTIKRIIAILLLGMLACQTLVPSTHPTPTPMMIAEPTSKPEPTDIPPTEGAGDGFEITVENQTPYEICYVYISQSDDDWGNDVLSLDETIEAGTSRTFEVSAEMHDLLIQDCDAVTMGTAWELTEGVILTFGGAGLIPFRVVNESTALICTLSFTHPASAALGEDGMGVGEVLEPQGGERLFFVDPGLYNIFAEDCDAREVHSAAAFDVTADAVWTIPADALPAGDGEPFTVVVQNHTPYDVCYVYISPAYAESWGDDWMSDNEVIAPGDERAFDVPGGARDIAAVDCEDAVVATAWEVVDDVTLTPGDTGTVALRVVNESADDICYFYASPTSGDDWGDDWMGDFELILAYEGLRTFYVQPDTYDVQAQDCDGVELASEYEVEITEDYEWVVEDFGD